MSRLQRKCFFASATMHGLLLLILLVSPAFIPSEPKPEALQVINFIPTKVVDGLISGGGNPNVTQPPPAPAVEPTPVPPRLEPQPAPQPPEPKPEPIQPKPEPAPPKPEPVPPKKTEPAPKPERTAVVPKEEPKRKPPKIVPTYEKPEESSKQLAEAREKAERQARARELQQYQNRVRALGKQLNQQLSSSTSVEMPGPGGEAFISYWNLVRNAYQNAWIEPEELDDETATVEATVTIARDGRVVKSKTRITRRSGHAKLDQSVERALKLDFVAPFPEGVTDAERSFDIKFNLKSRN